MNSYSGLGEIVKRRLDFFDLKETYILITADGMYILYMMFCLNYYITTKSVKYSIFIKN